MRWAILPHAGALSHTTVRAARDFNYPLQLLCPLTKPAPEPSLFGAVRLVGDPALIVDCVKRGEDDADVSRGDFPARTNGRSVVLRLYDSLGGKARGKIVWDEKWLKVKKVMKTNVLEDDMEEMEREGNGVEIGLRPFEVATFKLHL